MVLLLNRPHCCSIVCIYMSTTCKHTHIIIIIAVAVAVATATVLVKVKVCVKINALVYLLMAFIITASNKSSHSRVLLSGPLCVVFMKHYS